MGIETKIKKWVLKKANIWMIKRQAMPVGIDVFEDIRYKLKIPVLRTIFDVGANIGDTVMQYRTEFPGSVVHAFEPFNYAFTQLKNKHANDANVKLNKIALGDKPATIDVSTFDNDHSVLNSLKTELSTAGTGGTVETIAVDTIDKYLEANKIDQVDLMKIDTEGYELNVLEGGLNAIRAGRIKMVYAEVGFSHNNNRNTNFSHLNDFLVKNNFLFYALYNVVHFYNKPDASFGNVLYIHNSLLKEVKLSNFEWA